MALTNVYEDLNELRGVFSIEQLDKYIINSLYNYSENVGIRCSDDIVENTMHLFYLIDSNGALVQYENNSKLNLFLDNHEVSSQLRYQITLLRKLPDSTSTKELFKNKILNLYYTGFNELDSDKEKELFAGMIAVALHSSDYWYDNYDKWRTKIYELITGSEIEYRDCRHNTAQDLKDVGALVISDSVGLIGGLIGAFGTSVAVELINAWNYIVDCN